MRTWQFHDADNGLTDLFDRALTHGPQRIRRRGDVLIVLSEADYQQLTGERETLKDYLLSGPEISDLDLIRDPGPMRDVAW